MATKPEHAADCGCCSGLDSETPRTIDNRPGASAITYRVGTHSSFKESLLARLSSSSYPALAGLGTRTDEDLTVALCDSLATSLDVLTFYQERIVNEHYLRTATERRSVLGMAQLIGYELAPGVAASTWLAFSLQETPGDPTQAAAPITVPVGSRVQSVPGQDEEPQTFETVEAVEARVEWNALKVQRSEQWKPAYADTDLYLEGVATQLGPGDVILIVGAGRRTKSKGSERWDVRALDTVETDLENERTRVTWTEPLGHESPHIEPASEAVQVFAFRQRAALFGHNAPDPRLMSGEGSALGELTTGSGASLKWKNYQIRPERIDLDAGYPKIIAGSWFALVSNEEGRGAPSLPGYIELYRAQSVSHLSRNDFGLSGKITAIEPDTDEHLTAWRFTIRDTLVLAHSEGLEPAARPLVYPVYGDRLGLDTRVEGLRPKQAVAVVGKRQRVAIAPGVNNLVMEQDGGGTVALAEGDSLIMRRAAVKLEDGASVLTPTAFGEALGDSEVRLRLAVEDRDGRSGELVAWASEVILDASLASDPEAAEIALVSDAADAVMHDRDRTRLKLTEPLRNCYERGSTRVSANVARATHGETVEEILGGGDARQSDAELALRHSPLTHVSADTATGRASTLSLRVNEMLWTQVPTLYGRGPGERVYTTSVADSGGATSRFGDGTTGARLPTGQNNVRATYRTGLGVGGNVMAGQLSNLLSRPLGVAGAVNPEPATGGEDPESLERARQNAPLTVLTLERAVSIDDYADFARAFAGIGKAHALWVPAGPGRGVFVTVAGIDGAALPETSDTHRFLLSALRTFGDPLVPVRVVSYQPAQFHLKLSVKVGEAFVREAVFLAVEAALRDYFGFAERAFGQGVSLDEVVAVAQRVDGVEATHVVHLYRSGTPARNLRLPAAAPVVSLHAVPEPAELLTLADAPLTLEAMP